jgi:DnaJ family protein C protein 9
MCCGVWYKQESYDHWRSMFPAFSMQDVEEFQAKYVGGAMEKEDVLGAYREAKGDMQVVIDSVPYCSLDDAGRFAEIIEEAGLANALFRKSLKALEKNRGKIEKHAATEAKEAEELAEELGLKKKKRKQGSQSSTADAIDLALIIRQRQKTRESAFDSLLDKYEGADEAEGKKKQGKGKKRKKKTAGRNDEPPESAFARTAARKNRRT